MIIDMMSSSEASPAAAVYALPDGEPPLKGRGQDLGRRLLAWTDQSRSLALAAALAGVFALVITTRFLGGRATMTVDDGGLVLAAVVASVATANAAWKASGTARTGWSLMAG